jgi:general stress protein 26
VNIAFLNGSGEWASISGISSIVTDRETIRKYYSPSLKAWLGDLGDKKHDGGPEDPRIGVIRVETKTATYAVSRKNVVGRVAEVAQGIVTGNTAAVNKLREITEQEVITWRSSKKMVQ